MSSDYNAIMRNWPRNIFKMPFIWKISITILIRNIYLHGIFMQDCRSRLPLFSPWDPPDLGSNPGLLCLLHWLESDLPVKWPGKYIQCIVLSLEENIRIYLEVNDNEHSIQQKLWDTVKFVQRNNGNSNRLYFLGVQNDCGWWLQPWA